MAPRTSARSRTAWARSIEAELRGNILPFWMTHPVDRVNGGFHGALTNDLRVDDTVERSAVLCARILWTYAVAYRRFGEHAHLQMARYAFDTLTGPFLDRQFGGVYWSVDRHGTPCVDRKHVFAQAYAIYGLAEYHRATGDAAALSLARELFGLIEAHSADPINGGNIECLSRAWGALDDMRLSPTGVRSRKSMNTLLHLMEAYTALLRAWDDATVRARLRGLIGIFFDHVIDPAAHHLRLFFDDRWSWRHLSQTISFGHDIEASWLLVEAAAATGDAGLQAHTRAEAVRMAGRVYANALEPDGSLLYESPGPGEPDTLATQKHWWPHAEAVVGFYNAYRISGQPRFAEAAAGCWDYIVSKFVDRVHGDWFKVLDRGGVPDRGRLKAGPWECPYHQSRMCFEMLTRLGADL